MAHFAYPPLSFRDKIWRPSLLEHAKQFDVIIVSGDAYVDHPSFPTAVVCRRFEQLGLSVAVIAQPDWSSDKDFLAWGVPRLFIAVVPGAMDSMVANFTATKMPRSRDRLSPDGIAGLRPKRTLQVYVQKIRQLFKGARILIGGIEASMRRFVHYDFWDDKLHDPILHDAPADLLVYGMAEAVLPKVVAWFKNGCQPTPQLSQTCIRVKHGSWQEWLKENVQLLPSVAECRQSKAVFMEFSKILDNSVRPGGKILIQEHPKGDVICFPPAREDLVEEAVVMGTLNFNRNSHPLYEKPIPGLEPVQFSVQSHRGCLGTCTFCALSLHQGRMIRSRTPESILAEIVSFKDHPDFKGIVPDVGGPAVNMYGWDCKTGGCEKNLCIYPSSCRNLKHSLRPLAELLQRAAAIPGIKKVFLGSGLRYDLLRADEWDVFEYIVFNHVSGQLKVAPEHFDKRVLGLMRKGENSDFAGFAHRFYDSCNRYNKRLFLVPYLLTAFPGGAEADKILPKFIDELKLVHEQIQEFTPTPGSLGSAMYYCESDLQNRPVKVLKNHSDRLKARNLIQKPTEKDRNISKKQDIGRKPRGRR